MRTLAILPEFLPGARGGIASFYGALLPEFVRRGVHVHAIVGSAVWQPASSYCLSGVSVEPLDGARIAAFEKQFSSYSVFPLLRRHLAAAWAAWEQAKGGEGYDIVETTDWGMLFAPWVARGQLPVNIQLHGSQGQIASRHDLRHASAEDHFVRLLEVNCLRAANSVQTYGSANKQEWELLLGRAVTHVPPPVAALEGQGIDYSVLAGVVVGRIQTWKGARELCAAIHLLGNGAPSIKWIGRDTANERGTSLSAELKADFPNVWGRTVNPIGELAREKIRAVLATASFGVVPSRWDVFNLSAAEMMATGLVVLCSRGAGAAELMIDGENGLLFEPGNAESMAECIRRFLGLTAKHRELIGAAARETVLARLNPEKIADAHVKLFHDLVKNAGECARVDKWTKEAISPRLGRGDELGFLDQLPLRQLTAFVARRVARKISPRR